MGQVTYRIHVRDCGDHAEGELEAVLEGEPVTVGSFSILNCPAICHFQDIVQIGAAKTTRHVEILWDEDLPADHPADPLEEDTPEVPPVRQRAPAGQAH